jgi:tetratricopeptide (TPR) repeat protein
MLRPILNALLCALLAVCLTTPALARPADDSGETEEEQAKKQAKEKEEKKKARKGRSWGRSDDEEEWGADKPQEMGARLTKKYLAGYELYSQEQYDSAIKLLSGIRMTRLNEYEKAKIYQMLAFCTYGKSDLKGAREYMQLALAEDAFPADQQADLQFNIARMYVAEQDWDNVIANLKLWFEMVEEPNSGAYNLMALAYFQKKDYEAALGPASKAVELAPRPNEGWIRLLLALRLMRQEYAESVPLLEAMVTHFPKKMYWLQLSTVHGALGSYERALVPLQLAYAQDLLDTDAELRRLAQLLTFLELPYRAALVLDEGIENGAIASDVDGWEMLSNSWIAAREYEKAVTPLATAARLDPTGDLYVRLAQVHIQREKWSAATEALAKGIKKGELEKPGDAVLLMGIAHYSNKAALTARSWFVRARGYADVRKEADTWVQYVDRELAAQAAAGGAAPDEAASADGQAAATAPVEAGAGA